MNQLATDTPSMAMNGAKIKPIDDFVPFEIEDIETSIPDRFEKIVRLYPERLAIKMGERALTYDELNRAANRIARAILKKRGQGSEPIALLFDHDVDAIAAIFGVLKAGKFYVVLNASVPFERNAAILEDSQPGLVITAGTGTDLAEKYCATKLTLLDVEQFTDGFSADPAKLCLSPETPAILVYTSGSTGKPKGVIEPHRNVLHSVMVQTHSRRITATDKLTLLHSLSFGSSKVQLFTALLNGASLLPYDLRTDGIEQLLRWLKEEEVTIYHSPPAAYRQLAHALSTREQLPALRMMYLSGVGATRTDFDLSKQCFGPQTSLEIGMGSTETNQITLCLAGHNTPFPENGTPAGYPVSGKQVLILDENRRVLPTGEIGEIAVRSRYLSTGYWRRPDWTTEKFLSDATGGDERIYLTGDLGRMLPDGFLIHMGRKDFMIKIRGFRVEIVEVERALLSHPLVRDAAVVAWDRAPAEKYLVGYVVARRQYVLTVSALRAFLQNHLPDYMIPSAFVFLDSLPLTNGKLDRTRLSLPNHGRPRLDTRYVAPRSELERQLVGLWEEVLDLRPIGADDNFFDLGGHSLLGARIISEVHRQYGTELPLRALFESPTIAQLAAGIKHGWKSKSRSDGKDWSYLFELQTGKDRGPLFFFPGGGGSEPEFFIYAGLARHVGSEYPVYGLRVRGADGFSKPHTSVEQMAAAYLEEIRAIEPEGPYFLIGECAGGVIAYEAACQLRQRGQEVTLLALLDVERPTLTKYWLYRVREILCISLIKFHWEQLRRLEWKKWPAYLRGKGTGENESHFAGQGYDLLCARAQAVLDIDHFGKAAPYVERARANYRRVVRRYRPASYAGRMEIVACEKFYRKDPTLGWSGLVQSGLRTYPVPGDHESYLREYVHVAARQLRSLIEETPRRPAKHGARAEKLG